MSFEEKIEIMLAGGKILKNIFSDLLQLVKPGINTYFLDQQAERLFKLFKVKSAFKNYKPDFASSPYPANICVSLNEIVVHGLPDKKIIIKEGDIVKIDIGIVYKNLFLDSALSVGIGYLDTKYQNLIKATKQSLLNSLNFAKEDNYFGDIGYIIQHTIEKENNFKVIKNLCGHDIGEYLHGELQILNFGNKKSGRKIKKGNIFTIEPMASLSTNYAVQINDFEFKTSDNSYSAHFEVTIGVVGKENLILTDILDLV